MANSEETTKSGKTPLVMLDGPTPGAFKSKKKKKVTVIASTDLHDARNDPQVAAFLRNAKERGEELRLNGLIHK